MEKAMYKNIDHSIKDIDEKKGIVVMYINSFDNEDTDGDVSAKGSFKKTFREQFGEIKHLLNHDIDKLLGLPLKLHEDDWGAIAESQMNMKKQLARDVFEDYRLFAEHNRSLQHSIRVWPVKRDKDDPRVVREWKLWEYSTLYGWGANPLTDTIDMKDLENLEFMLKQGRYSDERLRKIEALYDILTKLLKPSGDPSNTPGEPLTIQVKDTSELINFYKQLKF